MARASSTSEVLSLNLTNLVRKTNHYNFTEKQLLIYLFKCPLQLILLGLKALIFAFGLFSGGAGAATNRRSFEAEEVRGETNRRTNIYFLKNSTHTTVPPKQTTDIFLKKLCSVSKTFFFKNKHSYINEFPSPLACTTDAQKTTDFFLIKHIF